MLGCRLYEIPFAVHANSLESTHPISVSKSCGKSSCSTQMRSISREGGGTFAGVNSQYFEAGAMIEAGQAGEFMCVCVFYWGGGGGGHPYGRRKGKGEARIARERVFN